MGKRSSQNEKKKFLKSKKSSESLIKDKTLIVLYKKLEKRFKNGFVGEFKKFSRWKGRNSRFSNNKNINWGNEVFRMRKRSS